MDDRKMLELEAQMALIQADYDGLRTIITSIRALAEPESQESAEAYQSQPTAAVEGMAEKLWEDCAMCQLGAESRLVDYAKVLESECLARRDAELTAVNARDAADIVRPPEPERRECWVMFGNFSECIYGATHGPDQAKADIASELDNDPGIIPVHMVELRPGERIVPAGDWLVPIGSVVLTAEQADRVRAAIQHNVGTGLSDADLAALGIEVDRG